jgi:hypothetical protein
MTITRPRRFLTLLFAAVAVAVAAMVVSLSQPPAAHASSTQTANPWTLQMDNPAADGLVVRGTTGTNNPFVVFDHLGQPIAAIPEAGGFKVFGDNIGVNPGSDIYHSQVTISPNDPDNNVCVRSGQLWIGGSGHIWHCVDLDGSGPSPLAWWQWL